MRRAANFNGGSKHRLSDGRCVIDEKGLPATGKLQAEHRQKMTLLIKSV
jgi:hypothetical protein